MGFLSRVREQWARRDRLPEQTVWRSHQRGEQVIPADPSIPLDRWQGGSARLWWYTVSHKTAVIRVVKGGQQGNLHIVCSMVSHICGAPEWHDSTFEIEAVDGAYLVRDEKAGFELRALDVNLKENVRPFY
jgi:hypothetical protein